jgi:hypothetical protein
MIRNARSGRISGAFWVVSLVLVAAGCAVAASTMGANQADPKGAYAVIFGSIGLWLVCFFAVKLRETAPGSNADLAAVAATDAADDPTILTDDELWAAMAIRPIDDEALRARAALAGTERSGMRLGIVICVLIFLAVPPIYFFHTFVPVLVGAVVIGAIALWKSAALLADGDGLGGIYELTNLAMAPLGLEVSERYRISLEPSLATGGPQARTRGAFEMQGDRYGRHVIVRTVATDGVRSPSHVKVAIHSDAEFRIRFNGPARSEGAVPDSIEALLVRLPLSPRWNGANVRVKEGVVAVDRRSAQGGNSLLDLWLAERVADALAD